MVSCGDEDGGRDANNKVNEGALAEEAGPNPKASDYETAHRGSASRDDPGSWTPCR